MDAPIDPSAAGYEQEYGYVEDKGLLYWLKSGFAFTLRAANYRAVGASYLDLVALETLTDGETLRFQSRPSFG